MKEEGVSNMSFDGIFTYGMTNELQRTLTGGRISKIHQPYKHEVDFSYRSKRKESLSSFYPLTRATLRSHGSQSNNMTI
ncbi:NFACT family protein [Bacillus sp. SL00103]